MTGIRPLGPSLLFATVWAVLAVSRPETTYHLAPLIVAAAAAVPQTRLRDAARMSALGLLIAVGVTMLLAAAGFLRGPTLLPWGGPVLESLIGAAAGTAVGLEPAVARHRAGQRT